MKVSIACPTFEYYGRGVEVLDDMFRTIAAQTFKDIEVVISDHSKTDVIEDYCKKNEHNLNIKYIRNENGRGNPSINTNNAIDNCSGEIIKIFQQDDFFYDDEALEKIYGCLTNVENDWLVCGCNHTRSDGRDFYWTLMPTWNNEFLKGVNSISSPSVMAFKRDKVTERFDENVSMMMDCEMYYRMEKTHGQPIFLHDDLVTNRVHEGQISMQTYNSTDYADKMEKEIQYCAKKHS